MDTMVSDRVGMSEAEWQARCDLAALYRISELFGWTDLIDTHMTVRIPGEPNCFLINNYGDLFDEITASSLVKMDIDGKVYGKRRPLQRRRLHHPQRRLQGAARRQLRHAHPHARRHRRLGAEEGPAPDQPGRARGVGRPRLPRVRRADVGRGMRGARHHLPEAATHVVLRNHGLLTVGESIPGALRRMYMLERACEVEVIARGMNEEPVPIEPDVIRQYGERAKQMRAHPEFGKTYWNAALRQIEGKGIDWRQ